MSLTAKQLDIFGEIEVKRIYFRDSRGRFCKREMSNEERLFRENNLLKARIEKLEQILNKNGNKLH